MAMEFDCGAKCYAMSNLFLPLAFSFTSFSADLSNCVTFTVTFDSGGRLGLHIEPADAAETAWPVAFTVRPNEPRPQLNPATLLRPSTDTHC